MARRLRGFVHVDGKWFGPNNDVPADTAKRIGDHAWASDADDSDDTEPGSVAYTDPGTGGSVEAPPRTGRGSGVDAWRAFAEQHNVDVPADASREDIIAACESAGVIEREG